MMNNLPNNPADLVAHAAFFESKGSYSLANKLLNELKNIFDNFPSKEVALEEFKKLTSSVNPKQTPSNLNYLFLWICTRWEIKFNFNDSGGGVDLDKILSNLSTKGLHQLKRDIFAELVKNSVEKKDYKKIRQIFYGTFSELDLNNLKKIRKIIKENCSEDDELNKVTNLVILLLEQKFETVYNLIQEDNRLSNTLIEYSVMSYLLVHENTNNFRQGVKQVTNYLLSVSNVNELVSSSQFLLTYILSMECSEKLALDTLNTLSENTERMKHREEFHLMKLIILCYYRKYDLMDEVIMFLEKTYADYNQENKMIKNCIPQFIEANKNNFLPAKKPVHVDKKKRTAEMHSVCFGEDQYIEDLINVGLKSLVSSDDFELIKQKFDLRFYIDTTKECEGKIKEKTKFLVEQGLKVTVSSELLVENSIARLRLGLPFYEVMQRCYRDNAIYINLPPDHIIGNGLFNMINNCPQGGAAGGGLLRASANKARSFMQTNDFLQLLKQKNRNNELAKMVFSNWRIDFHRYFESPFTQHTNFSIKNEKIFLNQPFGAIFVAKPNENFLTTLSKSWCPRYTGSFNAGAWEILLQSFDHNFPIMLNEQKLYYGAKSTEEWIICELSADSHYIPTAKVVHPLISLSTKTPEEQKKLTDRPYHVDIDGSFLPLSHLLI